MKWSGKANVKIWDDFCFLKKEKKWYIYSPVHGYEHDTLILVVLHHIDNYNSEFYNDNSDFV